MPGGLQFACEISPWPAVATWRHAGRLLRRPNFGLATGSSCSIAPFRLLRLGWILQALQSKACQNVTGAAQAAPQHLITGRAPLLPPPAAAAAEVLYTPACPPSPAPPPTRTHTQWPAEGVTESSREESRSGPKAAGRRRDRRRSLAGWAASTSATRNCGSARSRAREVHSPMMPAPSTHMSTSTSDEVGAIAAAARAAAAAAGGVRCRFRRVGTLQQYPWHAADRPAAGCAAAACCLCSLRGRGSVGTCRPMACCSVAMLVNAIQYG